MAALVPGLVVVWVVGGSGGWIAGAIVAALVAKWSVNLGKADERERHGRIVQELPVTVDLLAACLKGGMPWDESVEAVASTIGGPLGEELTAVSVQIRLGADPMRAWLDLGERQPLLAPLARTAVRASRSGTALALSLGRLAQEQRRTARTAAAARARSAGIRALMPLGLCFLPAFVLLGIVPAIVGIASSMTLPW
ncbi:type II secretion system F family protein [Actinomadura rupiterrae]|uniref:type II secretion system F family protein n=1 Tax=Actinomadura rupiterrae TaxID=559627 RepID=UPI0020A5F1A9|nr:type II secretion system F family protein [Actinomadura rupiterrae]MCP2340362.1 pilus assembly protein TadC [Actinomadura rupiterrae]